VSGRPLAPPTGQPPPETAETAQGREVLLRPIAQEICRRYREEFPDEQARYGDAGAAWCVHDNQHILNWAFMDDRGWVALDDQIAWLARVLGARQFPLERLARNLELAAQVVEEEGDDALGPARRLRENAETVRTRAGRG
jgi:hypothetical protein